MKNKFLKTQISLSILFFIVFVFAFFYFYNAINNNYKEEQVIEEEWSKEAERRDEIKALFSSVKAIEGERAKLETHFAKSTDVVPFLDTIEGLAGAKAEVTSLEILKDGAGLLVGMKATSTFEGLYKFLNLLENSPYELEFVSMNLQKDVADAKIQGWSAIFKIRLITFTE